MPSANDTSRNRACPSSAASKRERDHDVSHNVAPHAGRVPNGGASGHDVDGGPGFVARPRRLPRRQGLHAAGVRSFVGLLQCPGGL
jgi:hypothetical protein